QFWDAATGAPARILADPRNPDIIEGLAFSRDGKVLAAASFAGQAALWDVSTGLLLRTIQGHTSAILDIASSPDGVHLGTACWDGSVRIWDTRREQEATTLPVKQGSRSVAFGPDGSYLVSAGLDGNLTIWDRPTGQPVRTLKGHTALVRSVAI